MFTFLAHSLTISLACFLVATNIIFLPLRAIAEGLQERQADKDSDDEHHDGDETPEAKAARFEQKADGGDDRNKRGGGRGVASQPKRRVAGPGQGGRRPAGGPGGAR